MGLRQTMAPQQLRNDRIFRLFRFKAKHGRNYVCYLYLASMFSVSCQSSFQCAFEHKCHHVLVLETEKSVLFYVYNFIGLLFVLSYRQETNELTITFSLTGTCERQRVQSYTIPCNNYIGMELKTLSPLARIQMYNTEYGIFIIVAATFRFIIIFRYN